MLIANETQNAHVRRLFLYGDFAVTENHQVYMGLLPPDMRRLQLPPEIRTVIVDGTGNEARAGLARNARFLTREEFAETI